MTQIIDICNGLICKAKENEAIQNVKFLKAFREDFAQTPIDGYIGIVKIEKVSFSNQFAGSFAKNNTKGQVVDVTMAIDLYSDNSITGEELSVATVQVQQAMYDADETDIIQSSSISAVRFDTDLKSIYREIILNLSFCLCGDE